MDTEDTPGALRFGPLSRRRFLQATATATATATGLATAGTPLADAASGTTTTLSFTAATGGSATLAPSGDRLVAEIQNVLWSVPRKGGAARPLTPPGLEPTRPQFSPDGSRLVVCAYRGGGFHLWTLRP
ncbi:twin-arginine translocation signal domain-containing protein, partial [Streptomyces sp. T21Q-yed]